MEAAPVKERKKRKPSFTRVKKETYILTKEVKAILRVMARYKYLRSSFLYLLLPLVMYRGKLRRRSKDGFLRTLRRMYDAGLLVKPVEQKRGYNSNYCPHIYALSPEGERIAQEIVGNVPMATRIWNQSTNHFAHAMMICDTIASIEIGAGDRFITWQEIAKRSQHADPMRLAYNIRHTFEDGHTEEAKSTTVPDGLFGIRNHNGTVSYYFLEAENEMTLSRTNLKGTSWLKKALAYDAIDDAREHTRRLGIKAFQVLVVCGTPTIVENHRNYTYDLLGETNLFAYHPVPIQENLLKAPPPFPELFTATWITPDRSPLRIDRL